jgi:PAS domain S-box-containing protein
MRRAALAVLHVKRMAKKKIGAIKAPEFLSGSGEMASLMRSMDWTHTSLGPPENWPNSLKTVVRIMLDSRYAIWIGWGPELTFLYNDAYREMTLGKKHPWALGKRADEVWEEAWSDLSPRVEQVIKHGQATYDEDLFLLLERSGFPEESYHTFSYSPLPDDDSNLGGLLCIVVEDTNRYIAERRLTVLRETAAQIANIRDVDELFAAIGRCVGANLHDLPFSLIYLMEPNSTRAYLVASTGIDQGHPAAPATIETEDAGQPWPIGDVLAQSEAIVIEDLAARFPNLPAGAWDVSPRSAVAMPIAHQGQEKPAGVLIAGLNPYRPFDDSYRGFINLLAGQIAAGLADVRAYEEERKRAEALAEINRAKSTFFSNASHEFRTPLTLMLSPLEDLLRRAGDNDRIAVGRDELELIHRNGLRLLRLVNALLDFSRIEAGRYDGVFEPTDLAAYTAELASTFRSAMEQAGLRYLVDCEPLPEPAYVDRAMWEKIVLNLLSNAFKYTLDGEVAVSLRLAPDGKNLQFSVRDTGTGIPANEIPQVFERFHRIDGQVGRTHEGTGIGLALVQELVRLHAGNIRVDSTPGKGSAFIIELPLGSAHLSSDRIATGGSSASSEIHGQAYVEEALRWLPSERLMDPNEDGSAPDPAGSASSSDGKPAVLVADDNADMRDYLRRLLSGRYDVEIVNDGQAALESARRRRPELVLSDIMMPHLDGIGLLRALRSDNNLRDVPVILLSARAGEEASIEGLEAGADDYLIKPFGARELLARVRANLELAAQRNEAEQATRRLNESLEVQVAQRTAELQAKEARLRAIFETSYTYMGLMAPDGTMLDANATSLAGIKARCEDVVGKPFWETPWFTGTPGMPETVRAAVATVATGETLRQEIHVNLPDGGWRWFDFQMRPVRDADGAVVAIVPEAVELTERRQAEEALRQAQKMEAIGQLTGGVAHDFNNLLQVIVGNFYLLQQRVEKGDFSEADLSRLIERGIRGAQRAATLTQRLLAFSRRQPLDPKALDVNRLVTGMSELLQRSLGENISIETVLASGLWRTLADASELENALLNLAVNARDAMPQGGSLTIETANAWVDDAYAAAHEEVTPGQYVMIAVSDTGTGMTSEVIARAFEPFFTTKDAGQGTGLGLSQVYGFVKQSGGHVKIYSEPNEGTTVKIYMPRLIEEARESGSHAVRSPLQVGTREEVILVVEDDDDVRANSTTMLRELGYSVLEARDGPGALRILDGQADIDLLFTDIGLPGGVNGRQLADKARLHRPKLKVLFTSGYARNAIVHQGRLDPGVELLSKPFTLVQLSAKIRQILNQPARST